jgi:hypothetical protein
MIATDNVQGLENSPRRALLACRHTWCERLMFLGEDKSWERLGASNGPTDETDVQAQTP